MLDSLSGSFQRLINERTPPLYDQLEPLTVLYDGDINLMGIALGQGEAQLSTRRLFSPERDRALWLVLSWETTPDTDDRLCGLAAPVRS